MAQNRIGVKGGPPVAAYTTEVIDGLAHRVYRAPAGRGYPVVIEQSTGSLPSQVTINRTPADSSDYDLLIRPGVRYDLSRGGALNVDTLYVLEIGSGSVRVSMWGG